MVKSSGGRVAEIVAAFAPMAALLPARAASELRARARAVSGG